MGSQASRPPPRSGSLPVASSSSGTPLRDGPSASPRSEAPALPPPSVHLPDEEVVSAVETDQFQPLPSDSATLSAPSAKRRNRESRISLPDEARQYIANMSDSPVATPDEPVTGAATLSTFQHPPPPPLHAGVLPSVTVVSPMNFDGTFAQSTAPSAPAQQTQAATNGAPTYPKTPTQSSVSGFQAPPPPPPLPTHSRAAADSFNDTDDDYYSYDEQNSTVYSPAESSSRQAIPTIIRNAPSMTSMNTLVNTTSIQTASLRSSTQDDSASLDSSPIATSPTTSTTSTPPPNQYSAPSQAQPPKMARTQSSQTTTMMAPPKLTAYDMGTAIILVPISHIRANDRGKEVLSFVIEVVLDQMAEREGWKIEKLYSDVLALDGRVRQSLGRSALKKIAPLPDAKLFKDNAPSKVDQRKVCNAILVRCGFITLFSSDRRCFRRIFRVCYARHGRTQQM